MELKVMSRRMPVCIPWPGTIRIEREQGKIYVRWYCDTAGFHEIECKSMEEAEKKREKVEMDCLVWWPVRWGDVYPKDDKIWLKFRNERQVS